ncbi:MAG TPA: CPBP family intramembrane glutamic endopeptidase [Solirubrobacteraceae bacterium]|nr:CPBP family intramembrane glutamic endopeptidase [Solirubrobacteraceae bacterium]
MTFVAPESRPLPELPERPDGAPPPRSEADDWPAWAAPVALVAGLLGAFVGGVLVVLVAEVAGVDTGRGDTPPGVLLGATALQDVSLIAAAIVFARMTGPVWAAHFGLRPTPFWPGAGAVVLTYVTFVILAAIWTTLVGSPDKEPLLDELGVDESTLLLVLGIATVCVAAPIVEELFFRGFFYRALRNWARPAGAATITGVVFGAMHASSSPVEHLVPLAVLGALFCALYQVTGSLYPCIVLHAINNSVAFGIDQDWGWEIAPLAAGSLAACALIAWTVARRWRPETR